MERITIHASSEYDILIGRGLLAEAAVHIARVLPAHATDPDPRGREPDAVTVQDQPEPEVNSNSVAHVSARATAAAVQDQPEPEVNSNPAAHVSARATAGAPRRCCLVCDRTVHRLYGKPDQPLQQGLAKAGYDVHTYTFKPGENSKTLRTVSDLCGFLAERKFGRKDFIIALGGGVCGDLAGFAASIYMRGIPYVQVPTTLLAMADSSVGGKTGVNTDAGKNMLGTFWQPALVLADPDTLETLGQRELLNGLAEIIKAGFLADGSILDAISDGLAEATAKAVLVKKQIVEADERERGSRRLLNFGHTIGHAIEKCSGYEVPHGCAVMTGMYLTALAAQNAGWTTRDTAGVIRTVMEAFAYPVYTEYSAAELAAAAAADKKREADTFTIIYPDRPGHCSMKALAADALEGFIEAGLTKAKALQKS